MTYSVYFFSRSILNAFLAFFVTTFSFYHHNAVINVIMMKIVNNVSYAIKKSKNYSKYDKTIILFNIHIPITAPCR